MNLPIPDLKDMSPATFVMWVCAILLGFVLMTIPGSGDTAHTAIIKIQGQMVEEHVSMLRSLMVQCYNHAENVPDKELRAKQQRRCLTLQINSEVSSN